MVEGDGALRIGGGEIHTQHVLLFVDISWFEL